MSKTRIIVVTAVAFLLVGGLIILWSVYQQTATVQPQLVSMIQSFTDENFEKDVVEASKKRAILVDFYAEWCFPCRMLDPILQEVAKDLNGCATIGKINTDQNLIPRRFGINKIPAIFIIRDGEIKMPSMASCLKKPYSRHFKNFVRKKETARMPSSLAGLKIIIRGAGEMATGTACRLYSSGFRKLLMTEIDKPLTVRRMVSFSEALHEGNWSVEGVEAVQFRPWIKSRRSGRNSAYRFS